MKASVLFAQGAPLRVEELDLEGPRESEGRGLPSAPGAL